jgi:hypothetical protein
MILVWNGAGLFTLGFYMMTLIAVNLEVLLHYHPSRFGEMNWWLPALLTAAFNGCLVNVTRRMDGEADAQTYTGRLFLYLGKRHHIFWIPLRYWTVILLVLGLVGLGQSLIQSLN